MKFCEDCKNCVTRLDVKSKKPEFFRCFREATIVDDIDLVTGRKFQKIIGTYRDCYYERYCDQLSFNLCGKSAKYFVERIDKKDTGVRPIEHITLLDNNENINYKE